MKLKSSLPAELKYQAVVIEAAAREAGLDFFEVEFELLPAAAVNGVAAYGGFPVRYPSWRFGMEYERLQKGYRWGLSKIYELVINNDPTIAYLVSANSLIEQKLVMAHVYGHADFFKHNTWFQPTDRNMLDTMGHHCGRVKRYIDAVGQERVESLMDRVLSLETLIDPYLPLREMSKEGGGPSAMRPLSERARASLDALTAPVISEAALAATSEASSWSPRTFDIVGFLAENAPVEDWERDILRMLRAEAYYFSPQRMTKIMNEGWASFWHSRLLTSGILDDGEILDFADCHSSATATQPGQLNPYKLGIELFRYAEAQGADIFQLRRVHNDVSLIDTLLDEGFVEHCTTGADERSRPAEAEEDDWEAGKQRLLGQLAWGGLPKIELVEVDAFGEGELLLVHHHDGRDLQLAQAGETLRNVASVWRAPVHLWTLEEGQGRSIVCKAGEIVVSECAEARPRCGGEAFENEQRAAS